MAESQKYKFTPEQKAEIGRLVIDRWGDDFQTGFDNITDTLNQGTGFPVLWSKSSLESARRFVIAPDGTVAFDD